MGTAKTISGGLINITPAAALAVWALGTIWLLLFLVLEHLGPIAGEDVIDRIQAAIIRPWLPLSALSEMVRPVVG